MMIDVYWVQLWVLMIPDTTHNDVYWVPGTMMCTGWVPGTFDRFWVPGTMMGTDDTRYQVGT